ncbi:hypothetical protein [Halovenus marina]|uniref:hypothetical protein n=1 Tax=Halovenus marina TaxID=3396621 RepID=UPI003F57F83D
MSYRWTGTHAYRDHANDRVIEPGDEIPDGVAERIAAAHPHDVEEIEDEADGDDETEAEEDVESADVDIEVPESLEDDVFGESGTLPFSPSEHTVGEVEEKLADIDDPAAVFAIGSTEASADDRVGVREAVENRLGDLADE